jgi:hypothetical protein
MTAADSEENDEESGIVLSAHPAHSIEWRSSGIRITLPPRMTRGPVSAKNAIAAASFFAEPDLAPLAEATPAHHPPGTSEAATEGTFAISTRSTT